MRSNAAVHCLDSTATPAGVWPFRGPIIILLSTCPRLTTPSIEYFQLLCRTAIALEQEKVIERNTRETEELKERINNTNQCMDKLQKELDDLKEKYETNEKALKDRDETIKNNNMGKT